LGLAITKALVELHGGVIEVRSEGRDRGATFTLRLPAMAEPQAAAAPQASPAGNGRATPLRILLVEDHDTTATVMARLLRGLGHTVAIAPTVEQARRLSDAEQFEVVISDLGLPDGSGLDVIKHIGPRRIPFIAVSGYGMEEDVRQSREAGFKEHLVKPIDLSRLQTAIQRAVEQA
jgi:CheY-like chemotaxis protein